ncbi:MAG TPA: hypothetical protein VIL28_12045 [Steroidobacteraceae bacterium]
MNGRKLTRPLVVCAASAVLASCTTATGAQQDAPAVISAPTPESRAELQRAVESVIGAPVTLADDALTRESILTIERKPLRDSSGRRIEIREREPPAMFRLVKRGEQCALIHARTQQAIVLQATSCRVL